MLYALHQMESARFLRQILTLVAGLVLASSAVRADGPNTPGFESYERLAGAPWRSGNQVRLMVDGPEFYPRRLELIRGARKTIDLQAYLWCTDEAGFTVADELIAAKKRGVRVRVIIDFLNIKPHRAIYKKIQQAGIPLVIYNPPQWFGNINKRLHEKVMTVDGKHVLLGGANLCSEYMIDRPQERVWHDLELELSGPAVEDMQARFDQTWNWMASRRTFGRKRLPLFRDPTPVNSLANGAAWALYQYQQPYLFPGQNLRFIDMFADLISRAAKRVVVYAPYLLMKPKVENALLEAARHGMEVRIFTNSKESNDMAVLLAGGAFSHYRKLLQAGIRIHEIQERTLHAKAVFIDGPTGRWLSAGSHNLTHRSFGLNGEANLLTDDPVAIERFERMVHEDLHAFGEVTWSDYLQRTNGLGEKLLIKVGHWFEKLF